MLSNAGEIPATIENVKMLKIPNNQRVIFASASVRSHINVEQEVCTNSWGYTTWRTVYKAAGSLEECWESLVKYLNENTEKER